MDNYRSIDGQIRALQKKSEFIFEVELMLLNPLVNRNKWQYTNMQGNKDQFAGTPILVAYTNSGNRIGDGHNTKQMRHPQTGEWIVDNRGADCERICGMISEDLNDIRVEEIDGTEWVIAKGYLFRWYNRQLVDKIEHDALQGRSMSISIETLVTRSHMDGDVEVEDEYIVLGTTILGDGVAPAVEGARIVALQEIADEFEELKLRASSYLEKENPDSQNEDLPEQDESTGEDEKDDEPDPYEVEEEDESSDEGDVTVNSDNKPNNNEGVRHPMEILTKKQVADLAPKFAGYTVLSAYKDEEGVYVCLMSDKGDAAMYKMNSLDDAVTESKIESIDPQFEFAFDSERIVRVDSAVLTERLVKELSEKTAELEKAEGELEECKGEVECMKKAECARRVNEAKAVAQSTLDKFNANRAEADKVEHSVIDSVVTDIDNGVYTNSLNADGAWVGAEEVENLVLALCAKAVMEHDKQIASKNNSVFAWNKGKDDSDAGYDDGSLKALLNRVRQ